MKRRRVGGTVSWRKGKRAPMEGEGGSLLTAPRKRVSRKAEVSTVAGFQIEEGVKLKSIRTTPKFAGESERSPSQVAKGEGQKFEQN